MVHDQIRGFHDSPHKVETGRKTQTRTVKNKSAISQAPCRSIELIERTSHTD
jgi:hypothetical protein